MRFTNSLSSLLLFLLLVFSCSAEQDEVTVVKISPEEMQERALLKFQQEILKEDLDSVFEKYKFNASVAVMRKNTILYQKKQGLEDFTVKKPLDSNSVFAIASISKQFTAVLLLMEEEKGSLSTDDPVSKYLPNFNKKGFGAITIGQLLNHSSGITDFGSGLQSAPGTKFHYSNKGYRLLGDIIEKVSGKSYDDNVTELFKRLEMNSSTTANLYEGTHLAGAFLGSTARFEQVMNMPKRLAQPSISVPAGGIISSVSDLHRWNEALYGGEIISSRSLEKFFARSGDRQHPVFGKMGYGFGIMIDEDPPLSYFHSGYVKGAPSLMVFYPDSQTSLIILSNLANESLGKNAIFNPHKEIKATVDLAEKARVKLQQLFTMAE